MYESLTVIASCAPWRRRRPRLSGLLAPDSKMWGLVLRGLRPLAGWPGARSGPAVRGLTRLTKKTVSSFFWDKIIFWSNLRTIKSKAIKVVATFVPCSNAFWSYPCKGIECFDSFNTFSSKQKLQQTLKSWSNFILVLFGKGREIQWITLTENVIAICVALCKRH